MEVSTLAMTHKEWLDDRRKGIGGSDVATILGLNKWKSPYQLWLDKTGQLKESGQEQSEPAYWGNVLEEIVAKEFTERTGKKVRRRNQVFSHSKYPFLRANIDRDVVGENAILECKTANAYLSKEWEKEEIPTAYLCQVQHYMNVLNKDCAYIAVLVGGQKFIWKKIDRDQDLINLITQRLVDFWKVNVLGNIAPPIDGSDAVTAFIKDQYAKEGENEISLSSRFNDLFESRNQLKQSKAAIDSELNRIENEIKQELGKNEASVGVTNQNIVTWKSQNRKSINRKVLEAKYPEIIKDSEIYSISTSRVLKVKEIK